MFRALALPALLMLASCGATTPQQPPAEPLTPKISERLKEPCEPLPPLKVAEDEKDMRPAILENRAESGKVHEECAAKHRGVLRAVGATPAERRKARQDAIKAQRASSQPKE